MAIKVSGTEIVSDSRELKNISSIDATTQSTLEGTLVTYTDADVNTHLNTSTASSGEALLWNGSDYEWGTAGAADIDGLSDGYSDTTSVGVGSGALANDDGTSNYNTALGHNAAYSTTTGAQNTAVGWWALNANNGSNNTALGMQAHGNPSGTSSNNTTVGSEARTSGFGVQLTGNDNTVIGSQAFGYFLTDFEGTAAGNVAVGRRTMPKVRYSDYSVSIGYQANGSTSTYFDGDYNVSIGYQAGYDLTTGTKNFLGGYLAGTNLTTGSDNVAIGSGALDAATTATGAIAIGVNALGAATTTAFNVAIGQNSQSNTTGGANVSIGPGTFIASMSGGGNTALGGYAGAYVTTGNNNVFLGNGAGFGSVLHTTGSNCVMIGYNASSSSASVSNEITLGNSSITRFRIPGIQLDASDGDVLTYDAANGIMSLQAPAGVTSINELSDGYYSGLSVGLGINALANDDGTDNRNTAVGYEALTTNTTGGFNSAFGYKSLFNNINGEYNTASGYAALYSNTTGDSNTANGSSALFDNTTGFGNTAVGQQSLWKNTTGGYNSALGTQALFVNTTGRYNTASGYGALSQNNANYNVAVGYNALNDNTTGTQNVAIGAISGNQAITGSNNIMIGYNASSSSSSVSNEITLGNSSITSFRIPGLQSGASDGDVLTYDATNGIISLQAPAAGGPSFNAVASGSLANGDVVVLNNDGTVSGVAETVSPAGYGDVATQNATNYVLASFYDATFGKYGVVYYDTATAGYALSFATVVNKALTFETPIALSLSITTNGQVKFCYDEANQKLVCIYQDIINSPYSNNGIKVIVGDVTTTSVTFGSAVSAYASAVTVNLDAFYDSTNEKIVVFFGDSSSYGNALVCDFSTGTPSFGIPVVYRSSAIGSITTGFYDKYAGRILYVYARSTTFEAISGVVSGTSISFGGYQGNFIGARFVNGDRNSVAMDANGYFVLAFRNQNDSYKTYLYAGTVGSSDGYITWGNNYVVETTYSNGFNVAYEATSDKFLFSYQIQTSPTTFGSRVVTNSSGTLTIGTRTTKINPADAGTNISFSAVNADNAEVVVFESGGSDLLSAYVYAGESIVSNYDGFIGFSAGDYSDSATATVLVNGAVTEAQSGLTINQLYYVQQDGSLASTPDAISLYAGRAIATTKLLIKG